MDGVLKYLFVYENRNPQVPYVETSGDKSWLTGNSGNWADGY